MESTITIELPTSVYTDIQSLAESWQTEPSQVIAHLVEQARTSTPLTEQQRVHALLIEAGLSDPDPPLTERQRIRSQLVAAGLSKPSRSTSHLPPPLSEERREELARIFAQGGPLSEILIQERREGP